MFEPQVPAGHFLLFRQSGYLKVQSYWDFSYAAANPAPTSSIDEMIENVRALLIEAVRLRLRSDVPLAMYLSGGIDSAAIAGIASMLLREKDPEAKLTAFTLSFPGEDGRTHRIRMISDCPTEQLLEITTKGPLRGGWLLA